MTVSAASVLLVTCLFGQSPEGSTADIDFFETRIRPILAENCVRCHGGPKPKAKLRLDHISTILRGGDSGPALVPGDPERSLLITAVRRARPDLQMPPRGKLEERDVADLSEWVRRGAPWPDEPPPREPARPAEFDLAKRRSEHWAWAPVKAPAPPAVLRKDWPLAPTDAFILARLEEKGLEPAPPADRRTLLRRIHFDLTGLPPTPEEADAFAADESPDAYRRVVEGLLESPRFGERWARHWLDLVRYAETLGHEFDYPIHNAWRYRDYVIRALNADVPQDRFVIEHLAGDLLEKPRLHPEEGSNESIIATGFFWLGQETHSPVDLLQHQAELIENRLDVLSKAFLGLTVACARCHDHKFDAISTRDYYALHGVLASTRYRQASIDPPERIRSRALSLEKLKDEIRVRLGEVPERRPQAPDASDPELETLADFRRGGLEGWFADGEAFGSGPARAGDLLIEKEGSRHRLRILPRGSAHSAILSRRLQGSLRSPAFPIRRGKIHVLASGERSRINVVIDGYTLIRDPIYGGLKKVLDSRAPRWLTFDVSTWRGHRAHIELVDLGVPDLADEGMKSGYGLDGWISVERVISSDRGPPEPPDPAEVLEGPLPGEVASLLEAFDLIEGAIPEPVLVPAAADGNGLDAPVYIRGNPRNPGERVERRFLEALGGTDGFSASGSGRLELARRIASPDNPFFSRVLVNRVWHHLFGRGIVPSVDNFGVLGDRPSHPELLDWLAARCVADGFSVKKLVRLLVLSRAYRMSSRPAEAGAASLEKDPDGALLSRMPIRRLEGEAIRDAVLAISGRLDRRMFGPPVPVHLTPFMDGRGRPGASGPLDGGGRRSIYLEARRNFLSPFMLAFDAPIPLSTAGRRTASNVPAQALILLNDPFVLEQARFWAESLLSRAAGSARERIDSMYRAAFSRPPAEGESEAAMSFIESQGSWADLCHVLFNLKELTFVR